MRLFLLTDRDGVTYLASGPDAVTAAESVIAKIGGSDDVNRFSVSDPDVCRHMPFDIRSRWWMFFTRDPDCRGRVL